MNLLLDTHVFYWWNQAPDRLGKQALEAISDPHNRIFVSAASVYEIAYKRNQNKLRWPGNISQQIQANDFSGLPITPAHADAAGQLPPHHRDPFDRLLIAQAQVEQLTLATRDSAMRSYQVLRMDV